MIKDIRFTYSHIFIYVHSYIHVFIYSCNIEEDPWRQFGKCMVSPCFSPLVILKKQSVVIITRSLFQVRFPPPTRSPNYFYQSSNFCFVLLVARWWNECPWWACWEFSVNTSQTKRWLSNWSKPSTSCARVVKVGVHEGPWRSPTFEWEKKPHHLQNPPFSQDFWRRIKNTSPNSENFVGCFWSKR